MPSGKASWPLPPRLCCLLSLLRGGQKEGQRSQRQSRWLGEFLFIFLSEEFQRLPEAPRASPAFVSLAGAVTCAGLLCLRYTFFSQLPSPCSSQTSQLCHKGLSMAGGLGTQPGAGQTPTWLSWASPAHICSSPHGPGMRLGLSWSHTLTPASQKEVLLLWPPGQKNDTQ